MCKSYITNFSLKININIYKLYFRLTSCRIYILYLYKLNDYLSTMKAEAKKSVRYEFLHKYGKNRVFSKKDADEFFGYNAQISVWLIINNGLATRIRRGLYYIFNWWETEIEQKRDFFIPFIGDFIIGYWSALDMNYQKAFLLSSRKQKLDSEDIGRFKYKYCQVPAAKISYHYERDGIKYLEEFMAFALCVLHPEYTPWIKELRKYAKEHINKEEFMTWFRKAHLRRSFKQNDWNKVAKFVESYGKDNND